MMRSGIFKRSSFDMLFSEQFQERAVHIIQGKAAR